MIDYTIIEKLYKKEKIAFIHAKQKGSNELELNNIKNKLDTFLAVLKLIEKEQK